VGGVCGRRTPPPRLLSLPLSRSLSPSIFPPTSVCVVCAQAVSFSCLRSHVAYSSIPGHRNWHMKTAVWNLAGFLHCA